VRSGYGPLSADLGKPLPWSTVRKILDEGFSLGLYERTLDSGPWPCDLGGAPAVRLKVVEGIKTPTPPGSHGTVKVAKAELQAHEIVDLADVVDELIEATVGHDLHLTVMLELNRDGGPSGEAILGVNGVLDKVKAGRMLK